MPVFLQSQLDYIYFFYGLSFILLSGICFTAAGTGRECLHWTWLGLFGAIHGLNEWLDLVAHTLGDAPAFSAVRISVLIISFFCLFQFGCAAICGTVSTWKSKSLPLILFAIAVASSFFGIPLDTASRYALGLAGGIIATAAFYKAAAREAENAIWLRLSGIFMALYAAVTGIVVKRGDFFPASIINYDTFFEATGVPAQLVRGLTAFSIMLLLVFYNRAKYKKDDYAYGRSWPRYSTFLLAAVVLIVAAGWYITNAVGNHGEDEARKNLLSRAMTAAASINPARVATLTGTPSDDGTPDFERIREQLEKIHDVNPDSRFVYLMVLRDRHLVFLADAEPRGSKDYSPPGQVYNETLPRDVADYTQARPAVYPPYTDAWGTWVTGSAYVRDAEGRVLAMLGIDISAAAWLSHVMHYRLFCIIITLTLCLITVSLYIAWHWSRESVGRGAALRVAEEKLAGEKKIREITRALGEGVLVRDTDGKITFANPEAERLLGWGEGELTGRIICEVLQCKDEYHKGKDGEKCRVGLTLTRGETVRKDDEYFTRRDGSDFPASYVSSPIVEDARITGAVMAFQDISYRKEIEQQKTDFYAMISHDLKTPLTIIQGYTDMLLKEKGFDPDASRMVSNISEGCRKLLSLINDFLTVSRLEHGSLALRKEHEDIRTLLAEMDDEFQALIRNRGLEYVKDVPEGLPAAAFDRAYVYRAVVNLFGNAVKYSRPGGRVALSAGAHSEDGREYVYISVSDTGPGIPVEEREKIFQKYYRMKTASGTRGSGLGLAIVKAVATAHGGMARCEDGGGTGSVFKLFLPVDRA